MELHVVFGAGQVGAPLAEALLANAHRVRVVRRTRCDAAVGAELVTGDAFDRAFCVRSAIGATAVYHCLNVAYSTRAWADELPKLQNNLIEAAGKANARLVVLENLYMLGTPTGPLTETSASAPSCRKGELRQHLADALMAAHQAGSVRAVAGRASDLFGPGVRESQIGEQLYRRVLAGKSARVFGNPDALHSFSYALDVARGLAALGSTDDTLGSAWMLPVAPAISTRAFHERLCSALGVTASLRVVPQWALQLFGVVAPMLRELAEMTYEWQHDFVVSDARFRTRFELAPTDLDAALKATATWAAATFAPKARRPSVASLA